VRAATEPPWSRRRLAGAVIEQPLLALLSRGPAGNVCSAHSHVTRRGRRAYVPPPSESAVFDNDGRSVDSRCYARWPLHDRARRLLAGAAGNSPPIRWLPLPPRARRGGAAWTKVMELVGITHAGMDPPGFEALARECFNTALPSRPSAALPPPSPTCRCWSLLRAASASTASAPTSFRPVDGAFLRAIQPGALRAFPPEAGDRLSVRTTYVVRDGKPRCSAAARTGGAQ